ncbi:hypothetical protein Lser_V15G16996 [Lactuca serriola]
MEELLSESQLSGESTGSIGRSKGAMISSSHHKIYVTVVTEFVIQYTTEGLEKARDRLTEAAALRERFVLGTSVSRRVAVF